VFFLFLWKLIDFCGLGKRKVLGRNDASSLFSFLRFFFLFLIFFPRFTGTQNVTYLRLFSLSIYIHVTYCYLPIYIYDTTPILFF
jgi:hypothetical protein